MNRGGEGGEVVPPAAASLRIASAGGLEVARKGWGGDSRLGRLSFEA